MRYLYDEVKKKIEVYSFQINQGGPEFIREHGIVSVTFIDDKFSSVAFPLTGQYSRNGWKIMAAINRKIEEIETRKANEAAK